MRIVWMFVYRLVLAAVQRRSPILAQKLGARSPRGAVVIAWSGMRGLVALATAFALPPDFPGRDLIVLCAFCVVLGTLVIQGLTLRPLLLLLRLEGDGSVEREISRARVAMIQAALDCLDGDTSRPANAIRERYAAAAIEHLLKVFLAVVDNLRAPRRHRVEGCIHCIARFV